MPRAELPQNIRIKKRIDLLFEKKKIVISVLILGAVVAAVFSYMSPKKYRASGQIFFKASSINNQFLTHSGSLKNEIDFLNSENLINDVVTELKKDDILLNFKDLDQKREVLRDKSSNSLGIQVVNDEPEKSAAIANSIINKFSEESTLNSKAVLISSLKKISEREKALQEDKRRNLAQQASRISVFNMQQEDLITQIAEFESELESLELDNYRFSLQLNKFQSILENDYSRLSERILFIEDEQHNEQKTKLERIYAIEYLEELTKDFKNFQVNYPWEETYSPNSINSETDKFEENLTKLVNQLAQSETNVNLEFLKNLSINLYENQIRVNSIDITKSIIFNALTTLEQRFNLIPFSIIDEARQLRMKKVNNSLELKLNSKFEKLKAKEKTFFAEIESITNAMVPKSFFSPDITLNIILGALIGLIIGIFIAISSTTTKIELITTTKDLEESGYKIIAQIPSFPAGSPLLFDSLNESENEKLDPKILNSFSSIETFLKYGNLDNPLKTILVTSGQDGEGKSVIASNIAIALANSGNKVLLVDADLKKPQLNKFFKIKATPSLAHYLFRKKELDEIIKSTHNNNLDLITCIEFPQNPAVIITSERMQNFMNQVKQKYDYVVYDTSSLCLLKETASITKNIDEVIIVVKANYSKISDFLNTDFMLTESGTSNFNVVLNDVKA